MGMRISNLICINDWHPRLDATLENNPQVSAYHTNGAFDWFCQNYLSYPCKARKLQHRKRENSCDSNQESSDPNKPVEHTFEGRSA